MRNFIIIVIAFFSLNVMAQEKTQIETKKQSAETMAEAETKKLTKQLKLNTDQQISVYNVILEHFNEELNNKQKVKEMLASKEKVSKAEMKNTMTKNREESSQKLNGQLKKILTTEQYKDYHQSISVKQKANQKVIKKN